jgi:MFS family permease
LIGPFVGAAILRRFDLSAVYILAIGTALVCCVVVALSSEVEESGRVAPVAVAPLQLLKTHGRMMMTLGSGIALLAAVRATRQTALPLWAEHIGLHPSTTSLIFGLSGLMDVLLFYPAGKIMDRKGRLWVALPAMGVMGVGLICLPLTHSVGTLAVVAMAVGLGNGIGSGIVMTIGADVAPPAQRAQFLGLWRLMSDSGNAAGPLVISAGAALGSLAIGIVAGGAAGLASLAALAVFLPRYSVHASARTRRQAGLNRDGSTPSH